MNGNNCDYSFLSVYDNLIAEYRGKLPVENLNLLP